MAANQSIRSPQVLSVIIPCNNWLARWVVKYQFKEVSSYKRITGFSFVLGLEGSPCME